jgi:hypothetical protein
MARARQREISLDSSRRNNALLENCPGEEQKFGRAKRANALEETFFLGNRFPELGKAGQGFLPAPNIVFAR